MDALTRLVLIPGALALFIGAIVVLASVVS
jgi:hypothetical protein